ncbi:MAG: hypothetical protein HYX92_21075 [Chloroflexi bacterium]|nr:hypothetical protein [Chloroflexota bacterium]
MPKEMVRVHNPAGVKTAVPELPAAPRIDSLRGKSMVVLYNYKPGGDILLARVEKRLKEAFGVGSLPWMLRHPGGAIAEGMLKELSEKCDFVLNGIGD